MKLAQAIAALIGCPCGHGERLDGDANRQLSLGAVAARALTTLVRVDSMCSRAS